MTESLRKYSRQLLFRGHIFANTLFVRVKTSYQKKNIIDYQFPFNCCMSLCQLVQPVDRPDILIFLFRFVGGGRSKCWTDMCRGFICPPAHRETMDL